jgi:hypothetical protein
VGEGIDVGGRVAGEDTALHPAAMKEIIKMIPVRLKVAKYLYVI